MPFNSGSRLSALDLRPPDAQALHRNRRLPDEHARQRAGRGQPAQRGLRADGRAPAEADTILFNTCSVRQHAEDKIYSALGRLKNAKREHPRQGDRRAGLHGPEGPGTDLQAGPVRRPGRRAGQLHQVPALVREVAGRAAASGWRSASAASDGTRDEIERSHESFDPLRDPAMRPTPYQAYVRIMIGCDKFCTYCIVPSVRGPEQSRPPAGDPGRSPATGRRRLPRNHAAGPDGQQLPLPRGRADVAAERFARGAARDRRPRADQVRHQLSEGHDRRPAGGGPRPAQMQQVPARAGAERLERACSSG